MVSATGGQRYESQYFGVSWCHDRCMWKAEIDFRGAEILIGHYLVERHAAAAYNLAAKEVLGKYAVMNDVEIPRGMSIRLPGNDPLLDRPRVIAAPDDKPMVVTVRVPAAIHRWLVNEAHDHRVSLNKLCIAKLTVGMPEELTAGL